MTREQIAELRAAMWRWIAWASPHYPPEGWELCRRPEDLL